MRSRMGLRIRMAGYATGRRLLNGTSWTSGRNIYKVALQDILQFQSVTELRMRIP